MFKAGMKYKINYPNFKQYHNKECTIVYDPIGTLALVRFNDGLERYCDTENLVSLETNASQELKIKSICQCDSRQLFNFGHEKTCVERKL